MVHPVNIDKRNRLGPCACCYSWDKRLDVCVDLTGSSPLTHTGMVDFVPGRAVIDAAHRKRVKYEAKCANIGYGFLPYSFSSLGELEKDAVTLLKQIRKFSVTQDIGALDAIHILDMIKFAIAKGVGAQLQGDYDTCRLRIESYIELQDYALWEIKEDVNSFKPVARTTTNADGTSTSTIPGAVTAEEKIQKKNDLKARSILMMTLPSEHLLTFNQYKDAKTLFEAIEARFGGNEATKKTQKTLLKQMHENFSASCSESLDSIFTRLQKIISQLAILDLGSISFDDLYNNFKIVEQEVKRSVTSSSNSNSQNVAFVSTPSSTNDVNTSNVLVNTASSSLSTASSTYNTARLSDATIYAFLANQPNGSQVVHEDLEQIHEDDLEEMDLKWQLALLSMKARKFYQRTGKKIIINGSDTAGYDKTKVNKARVTPSDIQHSATSVVTYTFVYTNSEPGRAFCGADDEEVSEGGIPRVIILGYDGLPMQPIALPLPDYIPGPEDPQTPLVPQDEDEQDEHEFPVEEQPLPPVVSPTAESPGYVVESDPEEDPEEYEDDETEDGPVDYPMDGGEDGDDDDGDSSGDDADDEDEDEEDEDEEDEEEEEEHLAPADSAVVVPTVELVSPPEGTEPVIPPPSTDITTTGARITVRLQASISLPPEAEVERLLAMPTPPPSPPISLSPPSAGERLARCMAPSAHSSPPPVPSPLLPSSGCPTQIQTLRIASTQALVDAVTAALPSPPLPPLPPSLYIPPPVDRRDDIPESERPPHKRSCLFALGSRYEVGESSTARPTGGRGGYLGRSAEAVPEIAPMTLGEVNTRVTELAELHGHDIQDLYALLEDAQEGRTRISQRVTIDSQRVDLLMEDRIAHQETILIVEEEAYASREAWAHAIGLSQAVHSEHQTHREQVHETRFQMQQAEMAALRETDRRRQEQMVETLRVMRDMRREMRTEGVVSLTWWIEKMELVFHISGCAIENQVKFATCTLLGAALTWWNGLIRTLGHEAYPMTWEVKRNDVSTYTKRFQELTLICTKFVANETEKVDKYISGLPDNIYENVKSAKPKTLDETIELANDMMDQKLRTYSER
ncbi:hypothetical protein Tco_1172816 [Tanacetum coccineum]